VKKNTKNDKSTDRKIIDAAVSLFAKKGFAAVSVKELAEAAGVNIALISYYFGGKENLYTTVLKMQFQLLSDLVDAVNDKNCSPIERIQAYVREVIILHKRSPYIENLIYGEIVSPTICYESIVKQGFSKTQSFIEGCIRDGMTIGQFRSDIKPDCASTSLITMIHFYLFTSHVANEFLTECDDKAEYYISEAIDNYFRGVLSPGR
jgi:TetR/AcrR family transcriptional regulator